MRLVQRPKLKYNNRFKRSTRKRQPSMTMVKDVIIKEARAKEETVIVMEAMIAEITVEVIEIKEVTDTKVNSSTKRRILKTIDKVNKLSSQEMVEIDKRVVLTAKEEEKSEEVPVIEFQLRVAKTILRSKRLKSSRLTTVK
jgi:hypothetical protein